MQDFVYQTAPMRVVFGTGTLRQLPEELARLGAEAFDALVTAVHEIGRIAAIATPNIDALLGLARLHARTRGLYP